MNKDYLPFYNSLNEKEKTFWLECTKEELIDHFIANVKNGEILLQRIDKAIEYINENWGHWCSNHCKYATETIEILEGDKE